MEVERHHCLAGNVSASRDGVGDIIPTVPRGVEQSAKTSEDKVLKWIEADKAQTPVAAVKAIDGASGARALSHINQIAMEQAKNRPQG